MNSEAERAIQWAQSRHIWDVRSNSIPESALAFRGPKATICVACGLEIGSYESRRYGVEGAVHVWKPHAVAKLASCFNRLNEHKYPYFYTDG